MANEKRVETQVTERTTIPVERTEVHREPIYANTYREPAAAAVKRISWAAVLAGVVVALVTQLLLSLLGIGIGASTIDPMTEQNPTSGLGLGAGVWFIISSLLSLFAGGWVAGRLAGIPRNTDSLLHGILTWGLTTLLLFYFLTSTIGSLIGGTFRVLGSGLSAAASGVAAVAPSVAGAAQNQLQQSGIDLSDVQREIETTLRQTGKPELQPGAIANEANQATNAAQGAASQAASDPANADTTVTQILNRIRQSGAATISAADRDALINVVMARTGKSRPEAEQTVASYERTYQQARQKYEQTKTQATQTAREAADKTASGVSKAALSGFFALLISALAAALGGYLATPRDIPVRSAATTV